MHFDFSSASAQSQLKPLRSGAVAIYPTETIYGIGCSVLCEDSIARIFEIKGRASTQPPPVLISDGAQLSTLVAFISPFAQQLMAKYWPGALTLILPARDEISDRLCGFSVEENVRTIGVRWTAHAIARELCVQAGAPFIATSANFSGATGREAAPQSLDNIPQSFKDKVDIVIDGGSVDGVSSTIVDCVSTPPRLVRQGAILITELE